MSASRRRYFIKCPRCGKKTCEIWRHVHCRFTCSGGTCAEFDAECRNPKCEYPWPKGSRSWPDGVAFWAHGHYVNERARRIFDVGPPEPLPPPFNGRIP